MQKKTMWITAAAVGAVLVLGGAGVAVASSDAFDNDDDRAVSSSSGTGSNDRSVTGQDIDDDRDVNDIDDTDVPATAEERSAAEAAALDEVGQGKANEFDTGDADDTYAYKVGVVKDDGTSVEVELDDDLTVLRVDND